MGPASQGFWFPIRSGQVAKRLIRGDAAAESPPILMVDDRSVFVGVAGAIVRPGPAPLGPTSWHGLPKV